MNWVIDGVPRSLAVTVKVTAARSEMVPSRPSAAVVVTVYSPVLLTVFQAYSKTL